MKFSLYIVLGNVGARYSHNGNSGLKYSNKLCAFQAIHTVEIFNWEQILINSKGCAHVNPHNRPKF